MKELSSASSVWLRFIGTFYHANRTCTNWVSQFCCLLCWATWSCCGGISVSCILFCIFALLYTWVFSPIVLFYCWYMLSWYKREYVMGKAEGNGPLEILIRCLSLTQEFCIKDKINLFPYIFIYTRNTLKEHYPATYGFQNIWSWIPNAHISISPNFYFIVIPTTNLPSVSTASETDRLSWYFK